MKIHRFYHRPPEALVEVVNMHLKKNAYQVLGAHITSHLEVAAAI